MDLGLRRNGHTMNGAEDELGPIIINPQREELDRSVHTRRPSGRAGPPQGRCNVPTGVRGIRYGWGGPVGKGGA